MTGWTSISVTEEQKAILEGHKPEEKAMGRFLVDAIDGNSTDTEAMRVVPVEDVVGREVPSAQIDYVEIESRCKSAIEEVLSK